MHYAAFIPPMADEWRPTACARVICIWPRWALSFRTEPASRFTSPAYRALGPHERRCRALLGVVLDAAQNEQGIPNYLDRRGTRIPHQRRYSLVKGAIQSDKDAMIEEALQSLPC